MAIASRPPVAGALQARKLGRPVVYIEANIHAGEVEGKEAALHLLRRYCQEKSGVLDKIVLLVVPVYNCDGNEKFGPQKLNRPGQGGPELVGHRENGQGLDLNRDFIKAESPEMNAALQCIYNAWDPDVMMDLHTTDGTRHGYPLTYSPPLNPNTPPEVLDYAREVMMPAIRRQLQGKQGLETFDYGNAERRGETTAWYTYGWEGRYGTNYQGLRNRIGILSEALTYLSFKDRIEATEKFTDAVVQWVVKRPAEVLAKTRGADKTIVSWGLDPKSSPPLGVRFAPRSRGVEPITLEKRTATHTGVPTDLEPVKMDVFDRYVATKLAAYPAAYLIPNDQERTVGLLLLHGVQVERLLAGARVPVEVFKITEFGRDAQPFQGHRLQRLEGSFGQADRDARAGTYLVRTAQPLGVLAFHLLEPEGLDGAMAWGFMGESFPIGSEFPVWKVPQPESFVAERIRTLSP